MLKVFVRIHVKNFDALAQFEREASKIMQQYDGKFLHILEVARHENNSGEEIHILEFSSAEKFSAYRLDSRLSSLQALRESAIASIEIQTTSREKHY